MAGPAPASFGTRAASAGATTISPAKPASTVAAGLLLAVVTSKNGATHSCSTTGWSLATSATNGSAISTSIWVANGAAAAPTFTWTGSAACSAQIGYFTDPNGPVNVGIGASSSNALSLTTHSSNGITTTQSNALVLIIDTSSTNTSTSTPVTVSGPPPVTWGLNSGAGSATDAGYTSFWSAAFATSGSSTYSTTCTGPGVPWIEFQIEIYTTPPVNQFQASKVDLAAWEDPALGFTASKVDLAAWEEPRLGFTVSKVEAGAWIDYVGNLTLIRPRARTPIPLLEEDEWQSPPPRRVGPVPVAQPILPWLRPTMPAALFEEDDWRGQLRRQFAPVTAAASYTARTILFVIT